jgi:GNAT superfamily N-acetyltransferase
VTQTRFDTDTLVVKQVSSGRERRQFLAFPWQLYRDHAHWVPPLRQTQKEMVGYRHHPYQDDAEIQTFIAYRQQTVVGRIAAIVNRAHQRFHADDTVGFVGFFESVHDQQVANGLFDAATEWLTQRGIRRVIGPTNPTMNYEAGLLIEGFDRSPTFMMPYGMDYYPGLWETAGFHGVQDLLAYHGHLGMLSEVRGKVSKTIELVRERFGIQLRQLDRRRFVEDVRTFLRIYNSAMSATWGFVPLSDREIATLSRELKHLIIPELTAMATVEGRVVGAIFGMLDYNPLIKQIDGRLFPFGFIKLLSQRRTLKKVRIMSANVTPEYQRWGLGVAMLGYMAQHGIPWGLQEAEFSYVLESNQLARASLERGGAVRERLYRMYERAS